MIIDNRYYQIKSIFGYRLRALISMYSIHSIWSNYQNLGGEFGLRAHPIHKSVDNVCLQCIDIKQMPLQIKVNQFSL